MDAANQVSLKERARGETRQTTRFASDVPRGSWLNDERDEPLLFASFPRAHRHSGRQTGHQLIRSKVSSSSVVTSMTMLVSAHGVQSGNLPNTFNGYKEDGEERESGYQERQYQYIEITQTNPGRV